MGAWEKSVIKRFVAGVFFIALCLMAWTMFTAVAGWRFS